jgi:hypothetical protein
MFSPALSSSCFLLSLLALPVGAQTSNSTLGSAPDSPPRRYVSEKISSALSAGIVYQPSTETITKTELEKQPNTIIRLPEHVVEGERPPPLSNRDLHLPADLLKLSRRRYLSPFYSDVLNRFRLGGADNVYALRRFADDERLQTLRAFDDKLAVYRATGEKNAARDLQRDMRSTFLRAGQF